MPVWNYKDKIVLLGDAAHTICPFCGKQSTSVWMIATSSIRWSKNTGLESKHLMNILNYKNQKADALAEITLNNF